MPIDTCIVGWGNVKIKLTHNSKAEGKKPPPRISWRFNQHQKLYTIWRQSGQSVVYKTHTDIAVLANMCNLTVHTFTYNVPNRQPSWSATPPDPYLTYYSAMDDSPTRDIALYNSSNCHYDLLVTPDSRLALLGSATVSSQLSLVSDAVLVTEEEGGAVSLEEEVASPCLRRNVPNLQDGPLISPLIFMPCPKGPGRPKDGRQGSVSLKRIKK